MRPDGTDQRLVYTQDNAPILAYNPYADDLSYDPPPEEDIAIYADWSADGTQLLIESGNMSRGSGYFIPAKHYIMNADGSNQREFFSDASMRVYTLQWTTYGILAYEYSKRLDDGSTDWWYFLTWLNDDGTLRKFIPEERVSMGYAGDYFVSPNGAQIIFSDDRYETAQLYMINSDGTGLRALANEFVVRDDPSYRNLVAYDTSVSWSPDGTHIAFRRSWLSGIPYHNGRGSDSFPTVLSWTSTRASATASRRMKCLPIPPHGDPFCPTNARPVIYFLALQPQHAQHSWRDSRQIVPVREHAGAGPITTVGTSFSVCLRVLRSPCCRDRW
jgi:Tol biopolymer transport system component